MAGWVSIHRQMMDKKSYFSEPFCRNMAWIDLILLANHDVNFFRCRGIRVEVKRGQIGWGIEELAARWKWSRGKVERYLKELEKDKQIIRQKSNVTTLISILNYNQYQANDKASSKANDKANGQQTVKQTDINNNGNKDNNENKGLNTVNLLAEKNEKNNSGEHTAISGAAILAARINARKSQGVNGG